MPLQEFWNENPDLLWVYRTSFVNRRKEEIEYQHECINYQAWLNGVYIQQAVGALFNKKIKYPDKPFDINENKKKTKISKIGLEQKIKMQINKGREILNQKEKIDGR